MISTENLLATISIREIAVKVNSLNSLIKLIKVIFGCLGRVGCSAHKGFREIGCKGKSDGYRVIYQLSGDTYILLVVIYSKSDQDDIPTNQIRDIIKLNLNLKKGL